MRGLIISGIAASGLCATQAFAGVCPPDQISNDAITSGPMESIGVTSQELAVTELGEFGLAGKQLRLRRIVISPGGVLAWHVHTDRPSTVFIEAGVFTEHSSGCKVPVDYVPGDARSEGLGTAHWWENRGASSVTAMVADIVPTPNQAAVPITSTAPVVNP